MEASSLSIPDPNRHLEETRRQIANPRNFQAIFRSAMTVDQRSVAAAPLEIPALQPGRTLGAEANTRSHVSVESIGKSDPVDHATGLIQSLRRSGGGKKSTNSWSMIQRVQRGQGSHLQRVQRRAACRGKGDLRTRGASSVV